jgi:hypothetical protein
MTSLTVTIEAPAWADRVVGHAENYRRNKFAAAVRLIADRLQSGVAESEFEQDGLRVSWRLDLAAADEAA